MTPQEIISDDEIARVHGNANFGAMDPREVVNDGVRKTAVGYHCGSTQLHILRDHGLVTKPRPGSSDADLTKKGKAYARSIYRVTTPARAEAQDEGALGWIVGNSEDSRWRSWDQGSPVWVDDRAKATRYARREDAEAVHAEDEDAWCVKPYPSPTPALDKGAAGYLVALLASYCGDDTSGCTDETPCLDCVRMANVYKIPKTALGEFVGELGNIAAPYPSPTPAADADRVRIAVEALEPFAHIASHVGLPKDDTVHVTALDGQWIATVRREDFWNARQALAALKSEGK